MSDPGGELSYRLELLGTEQLSLEVLLLRPIALDLDKAGEPPTGLPYTARLTR